MRTTYDASADALYIYLTSRAEHRVQASVEVESPEELGALVVLDIDDMKIVGIEIVGASDVLDGEIIAAAELIVDE